MILNLSGWIRNKNLYNKTFYSYDSGWKKMENLSSENFKEKTTKGNVIVDYWAEWCGPCKMLGPIFEQLSTEVEDVTFAKVNVDEEPDLAGQAGVRGIPTMVLYKDGEEVDRIVGLMPKEELKNKIIESFS